ncbi:MAG TPA: PTS galactosamine/N-acetylgalactosamine transporter subunit IIA [Tissierellales bacterium]|nr:PTS galactosamine/N-acetylgalactosamine transporter subunit IIA [Tissierellales bacterium]
MIGILVVGHGEFAKGLISSVDIIVGQQNYLEGAEFKLGDSTEDLEGNIQRKIKNMKECDGILFLTDVVGGTPFKTCVLLSQEIKNSKVLSGINLPLLLEAIMKRDTENIDELKENLIEIGRQGIKSFEL